MKTSTRYPLPMIQIWWPSREPGNLVVRGLRTIQRTVKLQSIFCERSQMMYVRHMRTTGGIPQ